MTRYGDTEYVPVDGDYEGGAEPFPLLDVEDLNED